jgi:cation diffusion facilitator family transporter
MNWAHSPSSNVRTLTKQSAAWLSVGLSIVLAVIKVGISLISGSLSLLAEAVDSIIDLISDGVTLFAVRIADLPPDDNHPYGHARAENLGALAQTVLMLATYGWVLWNGVEQILYTPQMPEISLWVILVVIASLVINMMRVYWLNRAAKDHKSDTLAASVTNFTNDILRSLFVLVALLLIYLNPWLHIPHWFIIRVDAIAAVIVAIVAISAAWRVGNSAIYHLMDSVPDELSHRLIHRISELPSVVPDSAQVRARFVGKQPFVEVTVGMPRGLSLEEAHELTHNVENAIRMDLKEAQVLVHVEPTRTITEPYTTTVYSTAHRLGLRVHNLDIYQLKDAVRIDMDLELPESLTLQEAHTHSEQLEAAIAAELPCETVVAVHLEPRHDQVRPAVRYAPIIEQVNLEIEKLACARTILKSDALLTDEGVIVTIHCHFPGNTLLTDVHTAMAQMERNLRHALPDVVRVQIDPEPEDSPEHT